jgi:hypothetical protein
MGDQEPHRFSIQTMSEIEEPIGFGLAGRYCRLTPNNWLYSIEYHSGPLYPTQSRATALAAAAWA